MAVQGFPPVVDFGQVDVVRATHQANVRHAVITTEPERLSMVGIVTIAVGVGLRNGSRFARILVTILMVIDILGGIANLIWFRNNQTLTSGIITIIVSVVVLALLYNRRASDFFASTP